MYAVTKVIHFCYGHRLLNYEGKCRYLHGHNGRVEIELGSERLDERGMVRDFNEIKETIQAWIDREFDHKMLLNRKDPALPLLQRLGEPVFAMDANPTAEAIAELIFAYTTSQGFPVTAVRLWETDSSCAAYQRANVRPRRRMGIDAEPGRDRGRGRSPSRPALRGHPDGGRSAGRARRSTSTAA